MINQFLSYYKLIKFKIIAARNYFNRHNNIKNNNEIKEISSDITVENEDYWPHLGYTFILFERSSRREASRLQGTLLKKDGF